MEISLKPLFKIWGPLPVVTWVRAAAYYRAGKFSRARDYYLKGLEKYSTHPARYCARIDLAYCLFKLGDLQEAKDHLGYVTQKPDDVDRRIKRLRLTPKGSKQEFELTEVQRRRFAGIFRQAGPAAEKHWRQVMALLSKHIEF